MPEVESNANQPKAIESQPIKDPEKTPLLAHARFGKEKSSSFPFLSVLNEQYGKTFLLFLCLSQTGVRGFANHLCGQSRYWIFREYNVPGPQMQIFEGVIHIPWCLEPIMGYISDLYPIMGFHKAPYVVITSLVAIAAWICVGFGNSQIHTVQFTVLCLFLGKVQVMVVELLTQAKYAEELRKRPEHAPSLLTYVWTCITAGDIAAGAICGYMIVTYGCRSPYALSIIPAALILYPALRNHMNETPRSPQDRDRARQGLLGQCECTFLCAIMTITTIGLSVLGMANVPKWTQFVGALSVMFVVLVSFSVTLRPKIARMNAFFLIQSALSLSVQGATFYFYTNSKQQYADGPHFSVQFYNTTLSVIASAFSLVGIFAYYRYMKDWNFQTIMLVSNLLVAVLSLGDCLLFTRYNIHLGIPDTAFVMGSQISQNVVYQWQTLPGIVMLSQFCPRGVEATMLALLAGCSNLGYSLSEFFGAYLLEVLAVSPAGHRAEDSQFDNLWVASLISTLLPMLTLILIPCCIPNATQTERMLDERDRSVTEGSLWRRWCGENFEPARTGV